MSHVKVERKAPNEIEVRLGPGLISDTLAYGTITDEQARKLADELNVIVESDP